MEATTQLYDDQIHQFKSVLLPSGGGSQLLTVAVAENKIPHPPGTKKSSSKKVSSQEQLVVASVSEHCPRDIHVGDILMALEGLSGGDGDRHAGQSSSITFSAATNIPEALERTKDEPSRRLILQVPGTTLHENATMKSHNFATGKKHKHKTKKSTPTRSSKKATLVPSSSSSKKKKTTTPRKMTVTAAASENSSPNTGKQLPIKVAKSSSSSKAKLSSVKRLTGSSPSSSSSNKNKEDCTERRAQNMTDTPSGRSSKSDGVDDSSKPMSSSSSKCKSPSSPLIEILDLSSSTCNSPVVIHEKKKQPKQPSSSTTKSPSEVVSSVFSALCSVPSKIMDISSLVKKKTVVLDQPSPPTILTTSVKEEGQNGDVDPSVSVDSSSSSKTLSDQTAQKKKSISSTTPTSKKNSKQPVKSSIYPTIAKTKKKGGGGTKKSKTQKPSPPPPPPPSIPLSKSSLEPFVDFLASLKNRELRVLLLLILSQFPNHGSAILKGHSTTVPSAASSKNDSAPSLADLWDSTNGSRQSLVLDIVQKSSTQSMRWLTIRALDCILDALPAVDPIKAVSSYLTKVVQTAVQAKPGLARHTTSLAAKLQLLPGHPGSVLLVASSSK